MVILLVEDEALIQEIMADSLGEEGFDVIRAATGDEAIAILDREGGALDALITDFHMPGEATGADVAAAVRARHPRMPVIIASGRPDVRRRAWEHDFGYRFLSKPYLPRQLIALLREALDERADAHGEMVSADETAAPR